MTTPLPTARELEALKVIWESGQATVPDVYRELRQANAELAYTTVLSLIQTMERKGLVRRDGQGRGLKHTYYATGSSVRTLQQLADDFVNRVFDGAVDQFLVSALGSGSLNGQQLHELEQMIVDAKRKAKER
jgi:predicted transcriptional regulator